MQSQKNDESVNQDSNLKRKIMPEEKTSIGVSEKLGKDGYEEVRDILDVPLKQPEIRVEGSRESLSEGEERYVSSYEQKLKEIQSTSASSVASQTDGDAVKLDADSIRNTEDAEGRVQKLLDLALMKGVVHAVSVAENIDAYTLDRTHDRLADELSDELRKRGMLKEKE